VYRLLRPLLFALDAEFSHRLILSLLRWPGTAALTRTVVGRRVASLPVEVMGLRFANPVGLAAGLDKNAECAAALAGLGFGFLELGTVTPRPQPGNPRPRLFRLPAQGALINRMGFNNAGVGRFLANLARRRPLCPIGINIGQNRDTPDARALDDYVAALRAVYAHADYVTINVSSPNTPGLRDWQESENLETLLRTLKAEQTTLAAQQRRYVPLALKIAPDLDDGQIAAIARLVRTHRGDAVIATNTTVGRPGLEHEPPARAAGGLSGRPLKALSTDVIRKLYAQLRGEVPIIAVGGIECADDAWEKLVAGADLVQLYTALIYRGPMVVAEIVRGLAGKVRAAGGATLRDAVVRARKTLSSSTH
jgi:dihydroorotate dehydrogenase